SNPATIFDVFVELSSQSSTSTPSIIYKYPEDYFEEKILKHVVEFAFPCRISKPLYFSEAVQLFSFVLTNVEGKYTFGYCRHAPKSNTCLCFLSALPWSEFFYKLLNQIASLSNSIDNAKIVENSRVESICPDDSKLPKIPDNRHLTEYYNAVDEQNMIAIWASMLCERRIIMIGSKLGRLTSCILAANLLIYPMHWYVLKFCMPDMTLKNTICFTRLLIYLSFSAPMPFLIGVPSVNYAKAIKEIDMSDIVTLNIDNREFHSPFNDVASLPSEVCSVLKKNLRNSNHLLGDGVARSFLRALVVLIGGYREALQFRPGESILFSPDSFILSRPAPLRHFLTRMLELQIFRQVINILIDFFPYVEFCFKFIEDKLDNLNSGFDACLRDEFEQECSQYSGKEYGKFNSQYNEWFVNMKKEGGALMKQIRTKVKTKGKEAIKDFKVMLNELKDDAGISSSRPSSSQKISAPSVTNSPYLSPKLNHKSSTTSLTKLNKNKPLINLLGSHEYLSTESIDKISNKSESTADLTAAKESSLIDELRSIFSKPTEILSKLEASQMKTTFSSNREEDFADIDSLNIGQQANVSKSVDSLLSFSGPSDNAKSINGGLNLNTEPESRFQNLYSYSPSSIVGYKTHSTTTKNDIDRLLIDFSNSSAGSSSLNDSDSAKKSNENIRQFFDPLFITASATAINSNVDDQIESPVLRRTSKDSNFAGKMHNFAKNLPKIDDSLAKRWETFE
uniref:UDENN domain-containing protein n=1 Tax=Romanomermis culicivorax TaxID=13658 RepID=A0A915HXI0_ROMCU